MFNMRNAKMLNAMVMAWICAMLALSATALTCSEDEFECGGSDNKCIPLEWVCDNIKDCTHGKDESSCSYLHMCPDGDFMCRNGECVSAEFKCNGDEDCSDGSDELSCFSENSPPAKTSEPAPSSPVPTHNSTTKEVCNVWEFRCEKSKKCIDDSRVCNGKADCLYMEDEADCDTQCQGTTEKCADGSGCYNKCDGFDDCADGSDEVGCSYENVPSMDEYFSGHFHDCHKDDFKCQVDGFCIPKDKLCNGEIDCTNGEDEGGLCGACDTTDCEYRCRNHPKQGPECYCPQGSFLTADFKTCEEANPCTQQSRDNQCNQLCKPIGTSTLCYCAEGYQAVNVSNCEVNDANRNGEFFVTHGSSLRRNSIFNISGDYHYEHVAVLPTKQVSSISLNPNTNSIYLVGREEMHKSFVYEVNLQQNHGQPEKLLSSFNLKNIAVDWVTGNIYYTVDGPYPGVGVCSPDGLYCKQLIDGEFNGDSLFTEHYGSLIVHPQRGILIWLSYTAEHPEGVIHLAGMDGANSRILSGQFNRPKIHTIAMDYVRDFLFVVEDGALFKYDLHTLKSESMKYSILAKSMLVFNGHFYFIGRDSKLKKMKFGESEHEVIRFLTESDTALSINNSIYYSTRENLCEKLDCSHICVLTEKQTAKCLCPDQYKLDGVTGKCVPIDHHASRVKLSADRMLMLCNEGKACQNGGSCYDYSSYNDSQVLSPSCSCPSSFTGLYCEIPVEIKNALLTSTVSSSSGWTTFFWIVFVMIILVGVAIYFIHRNYPEFTDRLQHLAAFSPRLRRMNSALGLRIRREQENNSKTNFEVGSFTPAKSQSMSDLSKSSLANPVFGSSPDLAKSNQDNVQEMSPLRKSPSAACKLNLEG